MKLILVTGLSGSGKTVALHTLEDLGYYCIDNLPVFLLRELAERLAHEHQPLFARSAVGIDARNQTEQLQEVPQIVTGLRAQDVHCEILVLEAQTETLIKRFSETRRKHPLTQAQRSLGEAIELERRLLEPILSLADLRVDTTHTNIHQLRDLIRGRVEGKATSEVSLLLLSFGFKHGVPRDVDFVFDMRCLPNPHWQAELRPLTGLEGAVIGFLEGDPLVDRMRGDLIGFLEQWIPHFEADGRSYLTIALGCTGGQHRSVYMTEQLRRHFEQAGRRVLTRHRELS
jgi:RNase adapter protein RapZ